MAASLILFMLGSVLRTEFHSFGNLTDHRSWVPSVVSFCGYAALVIVLWSILRLQTSAPHSHRGVLVETILIGLIVFTLSWAFIITPLQGRNVSLRVIIVLALYPTFSSLLVALAIRIQVLSQRRHYVADVLMLVTILSMFFGDLLYLLDEVHRITLSYSVLDIPYSFALLTIILLTSHPSASHLTEASHGPEQPRLLPQVAIISIGLLVLPILILAHARTPVIRVVLLFGAFSVAVLAVIRLAQAIVAADRFQQRLVYQSTHDHLTGLGNRQLLALEFGPNRFRDMNSEVIKYVAALFIDLDRFKLLNDTLGHSGGDVVLREVAGRLAKVGHETNKVFRLGGDEFLVVSTDIRNIADARTIAEEVVTALREPIILREAVYHIAASVGVAVGLRTPECDIETLIQDADLAMYEAKARGPNSVALFDEKMRQSVEEDTGLENDLYSAVSGNQLFLVYQPVVSTESSRIASIEALLRWRHPTKGILGPDQFIRLAEQSGTIIDIGRWVITNALNDLLLIRASHEDLSDVRVNVNVSVEQFRGDRIDAFVNAALSDSTLKGEALCIEITESSLMKDLSVADDQLQRLRRRGVRLALDDFGTEYSSLAYLRKLPVDCLKIDRSFVEHLGSGVSVADTLVSAIIDIGIGLEMEIVAEGVETARQLTRLAELGCSEVQGYFYSRPVPAEKLAELVEKLKDLRSAGVSPG
jgi:diguanylate cyclase (GGDEF)-like protein